MSNQYIEKEVSQIIKNTELTYPLNLAMASAWIVANLKGVDLKLLDMTKKSSLSDFYLLSSSSNPIQSKSIAETIMRQFRNHNFIPISTEGFGNSDWLLLDFGDLMIHIFLESTRPIFDLDTLWKNAPVIEIPQEYYFTPDDRPTDTSEEKGYF